MVPADAKVHILCSSHEKGGAARKKCKMACIACQKCVKAAPEGAISMDNFLAVVNYDMEIPVEVAGECPMNTIVVSGDGTVSQDERREVAVGGDR
jgi:ferredoxin